MPDEIAVVVDCVTLVQSLISERAPAKQVEAFMQDVKWEELNRRAEDALCK